MEEVKVADGKVDTEIFRQYYKLFFPFKELTQWLCYYSQKSPETECNEYFKNREFSFTLENDIYIRYQSCDNAEMLKESVISKSPLKIDIGAVFNLEPKNHKQYQKGEDQTLIALEKELVFDIDMTDYDDVRTCCKGAIICPKCWKFIQLVHEVIDKALREDFGFQHLLWVYSGRRGAHCWVCDPRARKLNNEARSSIVDYLKVDLGNENSAIRLNLSHPLHPSLERAANFLRPRLDEIIEEQHLLESDKHQKLLLAFLGSNESLKKEIVAVWEKCKTSKEKWEAYKEILKKTGSLETHEKGKFKTDDPEDLLTEIVFKILYPRLDANVSKSVNHLLKSVFSLHPSTGRVCVPIEKMKTFNPFATPTIQQLLREYNLYLESKPEDPSPEDFIERSSLAPYLTYFRKFIEKLPKTGFKTLDDMYKSETAAMKP